VQFFRRDDGEALLKIEAHLKSEAAPRTRPGAV
jgi:hypothetical protein